MKDLLLGLRKKANLDDDTVSNLRVYESHGGKVYKELSEDYPVTTISEYTTLYAEVVPEEEQNAGAGDTAIYCYHFDKEPNKPHGVPFKFVVKPVSAACGNSNLSMKCLSVTRGRCSKTRKSDYRIASASKASSSTRLGSRSCSDPFIRNRCT